MFTTKHTVGMNEPLTPGQSESFRFALAFRLSVSEIVSSEPVIGLVWMLQDLAVSPLNSTSAGVFCSPGPYLLPESQSF